MSAGPNKSKPNSRAASLTRSETSPAIGDASDYPGCGSPHHSFQPELDTRRGRLGKPRLIGVVAKTLERINAGAQPGLFVHCPTDSRRISRPSGLISLPPIFYVEPRQFWPDQQPRDFLSVVWWPSLLEQPSRFSVSPIGSSALRQFVPARQPIECDPGYLGATQTDSGDSPRP